MSYATDIQEFVNLKNSNQIVDKHLYSICYSYKYKGALAGWSKLDGKLVKEGIICQDRK